MQNSIFEIELLFLLAVKLCVVVVAAYPITRTKYFHRVIDKQPSLWDRLILILAFGGLQQVSFPKNVRLCAHQKIKIKILPDK